MVSRWFGGKGSGASGELRLLTVIYRSRIHDAFYFIQECPEGLVIQLISRLGEKGCQGSTNCLYLALPSATHVAGVWGIHFERNPVTVVMKEIIPYFKLAKLWESLSLLRAPINVPWSDLICLTGPRLLRKRLRALTKKLVVNEFADSRWIALGGHTCKKNTITFDLTSSRSLW